jgi:hypothetical protein
MTTAADSRTTSPTGLTSPAGLVGILGAALVLAYALFAALQIQVLNPLATVPGSTLGEIHAAVGRTADTMGWGLMIAALLPGPLLAAASAVAAVRGRISARTTLLLALGILALGTPVYFVASFPAGMTLADTFGVGGADHAPWSAILHGVSALSAVLLAAVVISAAVDAARRPPARRPAG